MKASVFLFYKKWMSGKVSFGCGAQHKAKQLLMLFLLETFTKETDCDRHFTQSQLSSTASNTIKMVKSSYLYNQMDNKPELKLSLHPGSRLASADYSQEEGTTCCNDMIRFRAGKGERATTNWQHSEVRFKWATTARVCLSITAGWVVPLYLANFEVVDVFLSRPATAGRRLAQRCYSLREHRIRATVPHQLHTT